ncbi:helix-turn-helix domain-containing protein [Paenibacillus polymyxa]|uniref:helix-turn-helix domain-containing protein n=1 Tax=Paenibacillus polymyxa TaxID=1406 RepID=UPI001865DF6C|nr:helix-turn-helix transcriptional regulator [Paenibacillus polymyxa]MBE3650483.1 helix-turn-helix transcriptional regulator [Paenibacillus polymyxa]
MSIGLEYITKIFGGSYTDVAKRLNITPQTVSDWIRGKRKIPPTKIEDLAELFKLDKQLFQKELTEVDKIEIELNYLNRLSKRDSMMVPDEIVDDEGIQHEIMVMFDPHEHEIRAKHEELALQKLLLRLKGVLYNESFLSDFSLDHHFNLLKEVCNFLEEDNYFQVTDRGIETEGNSSQVTAIQTLVYILNNENKLAFGYREENAFALELEALLHKYKLLSQNHVLGIKEDPFFKDVDH